MLQKYLGSTPKSQESSQQQQKQQQHHVAAYAGDVEKTKTASAGHKLKRIMQVKTEQDIAIKELTETPRPFHARSIPLEVATVEEGSVAAAVVAVKEETNAEEKIQVGRPVPLSVIEPRYAMMVADTVLKKYGGAMGEEEGDKAAVEARVNAAPRYSLVNGEI